MENAEVLFKSQSRSPIQCRIYYISKNGIGIGGSSIKGSFPWRSGQGVVREILQSWARDVINKYDAVEISTILSQWANKWAVNHDVTEIQTNNIVESPPPKHCLSFLINNSSERKEYFRREHGSTDGPVMFYLSKEMIKAISHCLRKIGMKPRIQWEIEFLPNDAGIYRILLEGGKKYES